jgi:ABC-2 type transport system ATP-binding protein
VLIYTLIKRHRRRAAERAAAEAQAPVLPRPAATAAPRAEPGALDAEAAISVRGLRKSYDGYEAVRGISFDVGRGEIVAFLGPNGAGKTTSVEILEGYRTRSAGEVQVLGVDPAGAGASWRERIGVVLQESQPEPYLTARECLELYAGYYSRARPIAETLALVGLGEQASVLAGKLSGGQRRRLDVALALVGDPELVFLDEPTTGFDPSARRAAWQVVADLRALGKTIFLTTHYMDEAEFLADRIIVLAGGEIVAEGTPSTLGGRHRSAARITFSLPPGADPSTLPPAFTRTGTRIAAHSSSPLADLRILADWAEAQRVDLPDLEVHRPTLEDIYLELTGATEPA